MLMARSSWLLLTSLPCCLTPWQRALVEACEALPMTFSARQQNDAAEFLMLLTEHLEERLKSTRQVRLGAGSRGRWW